MFLNVFFLFSNIFWVPNGENLDITIQEKAKSYTRLRINFIINYNELRPEYYVQQFNVNE